MAVCPDVHTDWWPHCLTQSTRDYRPVVGEDIEPARLGELHKAIDDTKRLVNGEAADGVILGTGGPPEFLQHYALNNLQTGLERSGRSLDEFTVSIDLAACVADTKEKAREQIKYAAVSNSTIPLTLL